MFHDVHGQSGSTSMVGRLLCNDLEGRARLFVNFVEGHSQSPNHCNGKGGVQFTHLECPLREGFFSSPFGVGSLDTAS
jgi:hypothetical protein